MSSKKTNVFVETYDINTNSIIRIPCGDFTKEQVNTFLHKFNITPYPQLGCIQELKINQTKVSRLNFLSRNRAKANELHIEIAPDTIHSDCDCIFQKSCVECIAAGKCKNDYIRKIIGKHFFADKYSM